MPNGSQPLKNVDNGHGLRPWEVYDERANDGARRVSSTLAPDAFSELAPVV